MDMSDLDERNALHLLPNRISRDILHSIRRLRSWLLCSVRLARIPSQRRLKRIKVRTYGTKVDFEEEVAKSGWLPPPTDRRWSRPRRYLPPRRAATSSRPLPVECMDARAYLRFARETSSSIRNTDAANSLNSVARNNDLAISFFLLSTMYGSDNVRPLRAYFTGTCTRT